MGRPRQGLAEPSHPPAEHRDGGRRAYILLLLRLVLLLLTLGESVRPSRKPAA